MTDDPDDHDSGENMPDADGPPDEHVLVRTIRTKATATLRMTTSKHVRLLARGSRLAGLRASGDSRDAL
jgi:hypothetical protein